MRILQKLILNGLHFSGTASAMRSRTGGLGGILMLHRTNPSRPPAFAPNAHLTISPRFLDILLAGLSRQGFSFVSMDQMADAIRGESSDSHRRMIAITLDDGYRDNLEHAVPVFRKHKVPYTIFVAPGLVDGRATIWWEDLEHIIANNSQVRLPAPKGTVTFDTANTAEKTKAYNEILSFLTQAVDEEQQRKIVAEMAWMTRSDPDAHRAKSIMTWREIAELAKDPLCTIGAHTIHHYAVARLEPSAAAYEIRESGRLIEAELGEFPKHFAYPYGYPAAAGERDFRMALDAGYETAVTTRHGVIYPEHADHMASLPRISVNGDFQARRYISALLSGIPTRMQNRGRKLNVSD